MGRILLEEQKISVVKQNRKTTNIIQRITNEFQGHARQGWRAKEGDSMPRLPPPPSISRARAILSLSFWFPNSLLQLSDPRFSHASLH